jgi:hypothetical protein
MINSMTVFIEYWGVFFGTSDLSTCDFSISKKIKKNSIMGEKENKKTLREI